MKFHCTQCGQCCSNIRGFISEQEKEFLKEYAYGKLPVVQLFPIEKMSLPLLDFEAKRFKKWAQEVSIDPKIMPARVIFDLNSNKSIITAYYMDYKSCPFLMDNKCIIYNKKRAFICRFFPFNQSPFLKTGEKLRIKDMFGDCPEIKDIIPTLNDKEQLYETFGEDFLNIVEYDYINEWINKTIIDLIKDKKIRPAMNYPYNHLIKRIENSEKIDLMDFLVQKGVKTKEEVENLIKRFDDNTHTRGKLGLK